MLRKWCPGVIFLIVLISLGGCAPRQKILPSLITGKTVSGKFELEAVPFFAQEKYQCGPASMASLLSASGVEVRPEDLVGKIFLPGKKGSLQLELLAVARRYGRIPYIIEPGLEALLDELQDGRPVLILQNLGFRRWPVWHYAVIVGFDRDGDVLILHSGKKRRKKIATANFLASWKKANGWGMVLLKPGELPAGSDRDRYLTSLAQIPQENFPELLIEGYRAAVDRWPQSEAASLGFGNVWFAVGHPERAAEVFSLYLAAHPKRVVIRNNLAEVLAAMGELQTALTEIEMVLKVAGQEHPFYPDFLQTRDHILQEMTLP